MEIVLVDDNQQHLQTLIDAVQTLGHDVIAFTDPQRALKHCKTHDVHLLLSDIRMPDMSGIELLDAIKTGADTRIMDVLLVTGQGDEESAIAALRKGAYDYLHKPLNLNELEAVLDKAAEHQKLIRENRELMEKFDLRLSRATETIEAELREAKRIIRERSGVGRIITQSTEIKNLVKRAKMYHQNPEVPVIIEGETGTGKEVFARLVHFGDDTVDTPFVALNCSTLSGQLVESELFGYAKGAFTGSNPEGQAGKLELAGEGTLFLDEIGDLPMDLQPKLLRVLEERLYYRVGGLNKIEFNARVVCATNRNLEKMIQDNEFRLDLFHRLNLGYIQIPSLRERREDIPVLAEHFLQRAIERRKVPARRFGNGVLDKLNRYDWPGNVRELENTIERAVLNTFDEEISPESIVFISGLEAPSPTLGTAEPGATRDLLDLPEDKLDLDEHINQIVQLALDKFEGNKSRTADYLGLSWAALNRRLKKAEGED